MQHTTDIRKPTKSLLKSITQVASSPKKHSTQLSYMAPSLKLTAKTWKIGSCEMTFLVVSWPLFRGKLAVGFREVYLFRVAHVDGLHISKYG